MNYSKTKVVYLTTLLALIIINSSSCEKECITRVDHMKIYSVVQDTTTEVASFIPGWYHSEFQTDNLTFSIEFDHFGGGGGINCEWIRENNPIEESIEFHCQQTLFTETDTAFQYETLLNHFDIKIHETEHKGLAFLITQKPGVNFIFDREYYAFTVKMTTEKEEEMEDSCIVKIVD